MNEQTSSSPVLLFDGVCNLCNGYVQWLIRRDPRGVFRYASLQSEAGRALLRQAGFPPDQLDTVVLFDQGQVYTRADVALRIVGQLGGLWPLLGALWAVPRPLRNAIYDWVARNRYRWFGKRESCMIPTPELKSRFLD
jgi:predicted DCC family thiol-disulfide oxidoreductase YuxK